MKRAVLSLYLHVCIIVFYVTSCKNETRTSTAACDVRLIYKPVVSLAGADRSHSPMSAIYLHGGG